MSKLARALAALRRISQIDPDKEDHEEHTARMAMALGRAKGTARGVLDVIERHYPLDPGAIGALEALVQQAADVLRSVEWRGGCHSTDNHWPHCPSCGSPSPDCEYADGEDGPPCGEHMPGCALHAALDACAGEQP